MWREILTTDCTKGTKEFRQWWELPDNSNASPNPLAESHPISRLQLQFFP
jgi:hypothetical protein